MDSLIVQQPDGTEAPEGHDEAMASKFDNQVADAEQQQQEQNEGLQRPEGLPEKFKTVDDLVKSYTELEKKLSQGEGGGQESTESEVQEKGSLDISSFSQEYFENGSLSEETYKTLEEAGLSKDLVDGYIAGQEALANAQRQDAFNLVGGEDNYSKMIEWATKSLSDSEIAAFDNNVSGTREQSFLAIQGLYAKYQAENGNSPKLISGDTVNSPTNGYNSIAEMKADMSDPRYRSDSHFRKQVEAKLAVSNII